MTSYQRGKREGGVTKIIIFGKVQDVLVSKKVEKGLKIVKLEVKLFMHAYKIA